MQTFLRVVDEKKLECTFTAIQKRMPEFKGIINKYSERNKYLTKIYGKKTKLIFNSVPKLCR